VSEPRTMHANPIASAVSGALRTLSLTLPAALAGTGVALAQSAAPAPAAPAALSADIPAQPLAAALASFAQQTGLQVVYVSGLIREQQSHAVAAGGSAQDALGRLLQGTGLRFEFLTARSVRIVAAPPRPIASPASEPFAEVVVTANRRAENLEDVPITIQAFSGAQLSDLGVATLNQLLKYTANVSYSGNGPGTGNIFIRGLGSIGTGNQSQATTAPFPNVALYLDDQAMQFPTRNVDVYMVDLERIEILEGPQGTLFGGGAEAGAIRYITNKPKLDATTGQASAAYGITAGGGPNTSLSAVLNVPLIPDRFAVRAVVFSERQGGYVANVPSTISFDVPSPSVPGVNLVSPVASNADLVGTDTNPILWQGLRLSGLYQFNDDWDLLVQQTYQDTDAEGYFYAYPYDSNGKALAPYQIAAFTPAYNHDRFESTAWTLDGKVGDFKAVYTGSYMLRHIEGQQDYSNYMRSTYGVYYDCIGTGAPYFANPANFPQLAGKPLKCYSPVASWHDVVKNEHQSHELRISTDEKARLRALVGAYWEKFVIDDNMSFNYLSIPNCSPANLSIALAGGPDCVSAVGPLPGIYGGDPGYSTDPGSGFGEDVQRGYKQTAVFASVDFDIIPHELTLSAGTRHFKYDEFEEGSVWYAYTTSPLVIDHPNGACTAAGACAFPITLAKSESGFRSRVNLSWHVTPDVMAYYTFSQGFRPGGFNRVTSSPALAPVLEASAPYCGPASTDPRCLRGGSLYGLTNTYQFVENGNYTSDDLINNEIGIKSDLFDHRLVLNASFYRLNWDDVQSFAINLANLCGCAAWTNGPDYLIKGMELQAIARVTDQLTLQGSGSWNSANLTDNPCLKSAGVTPLTPNNPTPAGQCITTVAGAPYMNLANVGSAPPFSPPLTFNLRLRYDFDLGTFYPFVWLGASHIGAMSNEPESFPAGGNAPVSTVLTRYTIPAYTSFDGAVGVVTDRWTVQLTGSNLTDVYGPSNISSAQFIKGNIPLRPRVVMAQFSYRF
jgi:iron complex outermembrane receptor protein